MAAFEGLPEELMTLILAKLPVKSLLRFKCVQKSWYYLINSPQFIRLHRSFSSSAPQIIFSHRVEEEQERRHILSFFSYETLADLGNDIYTPITRHGWVSLSGSCDGLVCMNHHNAYEWFQIIICNPALREFRSLFVPPSFGNRSGYHIDSVAFGSDPKTGEYKVVMIGVPFDNSEYYDPDIPDEDCINYSPDEDRYDDREAKVYDFSTDSWRETAVVIPAPFCYSRHAISLNGAFHWCPIILHSHRYFCGFIRGDSNILTFNISDEVTDSIPLPDFVDVSGLVKLYISSKSQLGLIVRDDDIRERYEICVMTEYGVKESWTRLYEIGPLLDCYNPLAFWGEQHLLLQTVEERQLVLIDLQHQNLRYFPTYGRFDVFLYYESFVSVNLLP